MSDWIINAAMLLGYVVFFLFGCWVGSYGAHSEEVEHGHDWSAGDPGPKFGRDVK